MKVDFWWYSESTSSVPVHFVDGDDVQVLILHNISAELFDNYVILGLSNK